MVALVFFGVFWCGITSVFDFLLARTMILQLRAKDFSTAEARITHSSVVRKKNTGVDIRFTYEVGGKTFTSNRYRYDDMTSTDSQWAYAAIRANPVGATRMIHYNPRDPSDAVLSAGLEGSELFLLMFLTPFNAIGAALLCAPFAGLLRRLKGSELPGVKVIRTGGRTIVRLPTLPPVVTALAALALGAFLMTFIVAFTGSGFHPSFEKVFVAWLVVIALALGVFMWRSIRLRSGADDLILDQGAQSISLPMTFGRKQRVLLLRSQIKGIQVREQIEQSQRGTPNIKHHVELIHDGDVTAKLAEYPDRESAERLERWLREQLALPAA
jgi:hypothetical protein